MAQLASRLSTAICPVTSLQVPDRDLSVHGLVTQQDKSDWETASRANDLTLPGIRTIHLPLQLPTTRFISKWKTLGISAILPD